MFNEDIMRIKACIEYRDYYSALQYAILIRLNYKGKERDYLEDMINNIKSGNYKKLFKSDKFQHTYFT